MKITRWMRIVLIALSVVMALSLFACGEPEETTTAQKEETTAKKPVETTEAKDPETTESKKAPETEESESNVDTTEGEVTTEGDVVTTEGTTESGTETTESGTESGSETTESGSETTESETETTETTEAPCEHVEEEIPAVAPTCEETGLTAGKKCSVCGEILEEQEEVAALGHTEEVVPGKAATCTETGLTDGKKCSVCDETLVAQEEIAALGHTEEVVPGKAATCTEAGLTDGKKCSVCDATLEEQVEIPAGHTEEVIPAVDPTCEETGLTEGKKCSACGETITAQVEIPATGHNKVDKAFVAPTTTEEGWAAHKFCDACGKAWDAEDNEIAVPTIPVIVPETEKYWGVETLSTLTVSGGKVKLEDGTEVNSKFKTPAISDDRTYVRFERDGASTDGYINFMAGNTDVTGQYMIIKYRTDHSASGEFWANTTHNGHEGMVDGVMTPGVANFFAVFVNDNEWHLMVRDLSKEISKYILADENGNYTIQWSRIDILNATAEAGYFDIAYIAFTDDLAKINSIIQDGDAELCPHIAAAAPVYTAEGDKHFTPCVLCGEKMYDNHYSASGTTWDAEKKLYTGTCACGTEVSDDMLYKTEANPAGGGAVKSFTASQKDGFVRYTATGTADPYFHVYRGGTVVTGQYMVIKYRIVNNGSNCSIGAFYSGTVATNYNGAQGGAVGDGNNMKQSNVLYGDGEWHYLVVVPNLANNKAFVANEDGTYTWQYLRMGVGGMKAVDGTCYIDIDELAFADNIEAAESYAYKNDPEASFTMNLDFVKIDNVNTEDKGSVQNASKVVDLSGKTLTDAATSLKLGGWCVTPGGVAAYKLRVTSIDGVAVENPELIDWATATTINATDGVVTQGKNRGFGEDCRIGARYYETAVDLSAWAGHTINFEIVIVTNYGVEEVGLQINNVTVPAAQ